MTAIVEVKDLKVYFSVRTSILGSLVRSKRVFVRALDVVNFTIQQGETLALVGETGSGKTTTARAIMGLIEPTSGTVLFKGQDIFALSETEMRSLRRQMQIVFQDPFASLNPRKTVEEIIGRPLLIHGLAEKNNLRNKVIELLEMVGLSPGIKFLDRYPHEFSGGQRQRIGIARSLAPQPELLVLDEPVSSLDISIRSQILNLLQDLKEKLGFTYLLIAHDLSVVRYLSDRVVVLYLGKIVELADSESLFVKPEHPYTEALLASIPIPNPEIKRQKVKLRGERPSSVRIPSGCRFHPRCPYTQKICSEKEPELRDVKGHLVACHFPTSER
ncbi:MAG TPA: oligopeptide/dipeptide ABC transporter ATP-binding protein [Candidatus Bathyarchaeia archaeon]|nr:oligopeptide/dipeptide ABC transporter ATP-binding protein [Candidatus Bathyarchaeia archaeon]